MILNSVFQLFTINICRIYISILVFISKKMATDLTEIFFPLKSQTYGGCGDIQLCLTCGPSLPEMVSNYQLGQTQGWCWPSHLTLSQNASQRISQRRDGVPESYVGLFVHSSNTVVHVVDKAKTFIRNWYLKVIRPLWGEIMFFSVLVAHKIRSSFPIPPIAKEVHFKIILLMNFLLKIHTDCYLCQFCNRDIETKISFLSCIINVSLD